MQNQMKLKKLKMYNEQLTINSTRLNTSFFIKHYQLNIEHYQLCI